jgi:hypothetical protein
MGGDDFNIYQETMTEGGKELCLEKLLNQVP